MRGSFRPLGERLEATGHPRRAQGPAHFVREHEARFGTVVRPRPERCQLFLGLTLPMGVQCRDRCCVQVDGSAGTVGLRCLESQLARRDDDQ